MGAGRGDTLARVLCPCDHGPMACSRGRRAPEQQGKRPTIRWTGRLLAAVVAALIGLLVLATCGACTPPAEVVSPAELWSAAPGAKTLVVVYSRTGNTARVARAFADVLGADYLRLVGTGAEGDSWFSTPSWTSDVPTTPERFDLRRYDLILVGGPIWYWRPNALSGAFLRRNDWAGKRVVLFYTFEGGSPSSETEATWRSWVTERGGTVRDVVGIDRKALGPDADLYGQAQRLARERRDGWERP